MRRDDDLRRLLLLAAEGEEKPDLSSYTEEQIHEQTSMLIDDGMVVGKVSRARYAKGKFRIIRADIYRLTSKGHDFLARLRASPQARLYIEDIDSFRKVKDVDPAMVSHLLTKQGYLNLYEHDIQTALERILNIPLHKEDWGGEENDLYTANVVVNGDRRATAFLLKGKGLKKNTLEIANCGKNGDQLIRLNQSPAQLFIVQFNGNISENVIKDIEGKVNERRLQNKLAWFCIMDGQDTARLLFAYGELS